MGESTDSERGVVIDEAGTMISVSAFKAAIESGRTLTPVVELKKACRQVGW